MGRAGAGAGLLALGGTAAAAPALAGSSGVTEADVRALDRRLTSRFASNGGVRLHYKIGGAGPLVLFLHGFPGWWGTWRHPMAALIGDHRVAAMDLRAYNQSGKPAGVAAYGIGNLLGDVRAVLADAGARRATLVAHDWGTALAWLLALTAPELVERLVILNGQHPYALARELYENPRQQEASRYAAELARPDALERPVPEAIVKTFPEARNFDRITPELLTLPFAKPGGTDYTLHLQALRRTSLRGALNYYSANYPMPPYGPPGPLPAPVRIPTLVIYGSRDPALLVGGLDGIWDLVRAPVEVRVLPKAGHFVLEDARATVVAALAEWLSRTPVKR